MFIYKWTTCNVYGLSVIFIYKLTTSILYGLPVIFTDFLKFENLTGTGDIPYILNKAFLEYRIWPTFHKWQSSVHNMSEE